MLWDVSWDQNNIVDGTRYSDHVFALLKDTFIVRPTTSPVQTTAQGTAMTHINHNKSILNLVEGIERETV